MTRTRSSPITHVMYTPYREAAITHITNLIPCAHQRDRHTDLQIRQLQSEDTGSTLPPPGERGRNAPEIGKPDHTSADPIMPPRHPLRKIGKGRRIRMDVIRRRRPRSSQARAQLVRVPREWRVSTGSWLHPKLRRFCLSRPQGECGTESR